MIPLVWSEGQITVRAVKAEETPALHAMFLECADTIPFDPTFAEVDEGEVGTLVENSVAQESQERGFRMRSLHVGPAHDLAGYFHLSEDFPLPGAVWISILAIRPRFRRSGVGRAGIGSLMRILARRNFRCALGRVYLANVPALRFWTAMGFTEIVRHRDAYVHYEMELPCIVLRAWCNQSNEALEQSTTR